MSAQHQQDTVELNDHCVFPRFACRSLRVGLWLSGGLLAAGITSVCHHGAFLMWAQGMKSGSLTGEAMHYKNIFSSPVGSFFKC